MTNTGATLQLAAVWLSANVGNAIYSARGTSPSSRFLLLYWLGTAWGFAAWVLADRARLRLPTVIDHGWFVFAFWPIALPVHLFQTRGVPKGLLAALGFLGLFVGCYAVGLLVFTVITMA
jgi:hypothetical protein